MIDLLGIISILLVSLIYVIIALRLPVISKIIIAALFVRIIILFVGNLVPLPDTGSDSRSFELVAWDMAQDGFSNLYLNYPGIDSKFYSFLIAIPYSLFGRSILMAKSMSLFFGMGSVILSWLVAKKLFNNNIIALKVGWVVALFPSLILYSVITMREAYVSFFFLIAILGVISWFRDEDFRSIILAISGFVLSSFFHGGMLLGVIFFFTVILFFSFKKFLNLFKQLKINKKNLIIIIISLLIMTFYFTNKFAIPKIGTFESAIELKFVINKVFHKGDSSYPDFLKINSATEFLYKSPIRALYFLFSPFPWDINKISHMIGLIDSFIYIALTYLIFCNRKLVLKDPAFFSIFLILAGYFFVFGVGVDSFGTSIRHRSKFVIAMILLAAPFIPNIIYSIQKKLKK
jgi:hypothetical protein